MSQDFRGSTTEKYHFTREKLDFRGECFILSTGPVSRRSRALNDNLNQECVSGETNAPDFEHIGLLGVENMIPVVMSGGSGTRLWPVSRAQYPKQFCEIFEESFQALTLKRLKSFGAPWVLTSEALRGLTENQARKLQITNLHGLYEPMARNTAPAIAFLVRSLEIAGQLDEVVGVFPADQLVQKEKEFSTALAEAIAIAELGKIVTLGLQPTEPHTGYGYIQTESMNLFKGTSVLKFHEKPNLETAKRFLSEKKYFWNAGIFIFKASVMKAALQKYQPEIWNLAAQIKDDKSNLSEVYPRFPSISIDYAIMEKLSSTELACVPADLGWSDVGSWDAVAELMPEHKNALHTIQVKGKDNYVFSLKKDKTFAFVGVDDVIVVDTEDATLIVRKGETQLVKNVVDALAEKKSSLIRNHIFEERPWGKFEILRDEGHFKSKVIQVQAGQQLSLQSHTKREEHWIMTKGSGEVVLNDKVVPVKAGTYIHIPLGAKHRMRNTGTVTLEFIEVQLGQYFGEDDIVRYQDDYRRI